MADYAARAAPRADPFRSNPPYADDPPYELLWKRSREPALEQLVGWVERQRPPKLDLAKVEAKPIEAIAQCDGFRKGLNPSYELLACHRTNRGRNRNEYPGDASRK